MENKVIILGSIDIDSTKYNDHHSCFILNGVVVIISEPPVSGLIDGNEVLDNVDDSCSEITEEDSATGPAMNDKQRSDEVERIR